MEAADKNPEITTALTVDSICFIAGVIDLGIENQIIALTERQDRQSKKDERQKIANEVKNLEISDITTAETLYNAILKGGE